MHWANQYIGRPWENSVKDGVRNPDAFDCIGFFRFIQRTHFGRDVSDIILDAHDLKTVITEFECHPEVHNWRVIHGPRDGDAVYMRRSRRPVHLGIWLHVDGGGVLHCDERNGVVFQDLIALAVHGWQVGAYYTYAK
jgi:hypothetical protein